MGFPLWPKAGGGGCWSWRRSAGYGASKERSIERIDPIVAVIMAVGRSMAEESGIYADGRGLLIVGG